jgi:hypothetical protein
MKRFIAPLAVIVLAGIAPLAQANVQIVYYYNGSASPTKCDASANASLCSPLTFGDFTVGDLHITGLSASSNAAGTVSLAQTNGSDTTITNNGSGPRTLHIDVIATDFYLPITLPVLEFNNSIGSSAAVPVAGSSIHFLGCVDTLNTDASGPGPYGCASVSGPAVLSATLSPNVATSTSDHKIAPTLSVSALAAPYALDEEFDITIAAGGSIGFSAQSTLTPVPEPMSIALLGGVVLLTSRLIRRKRSEVS